MKVLVMIPAYNEADSIKSVVDNLTQNYPQYDYVVVNDGSRDRTAEICKENGFNLIDPPINLGLAGAFQTGIRYACKMGYDVAVQLDGDGQHDPRYIERMIRQMKTTNADIIIGSRFKTKKKPRELRMFGSNIISSAIRFTTGTKLSDPTSGLRMFNRNILNEFAYSINYGPEPDTISYLIRNGASVKEVQVSMHERTAGQSYLNATKAAAYMLRMCTSILVFQYFRKRNEACRQD